MAMIETVRQRQKNSVDFASCYDNLCALQNSCPLGSITANLDELTIDCNADRIRHSDWTPILNALKINKTLKTVAFRSYWQQTLYPDGEVSEQRLQALRKRAPPIRSKDVTYRVCRTIKECLSVTENLKSVTFQGIPLRERDLTCLAKGIAKNKTLQHLSLEFCQIGDSGVEILCNAIKNNTSLMTVNFSGCSLTWRGADTLAKVIRHQATRRHSVAWQDSLRYRRPDLDRMPGLRRITICKNPLINDHGAELIAEALKDDLWVKALDMQQCGISTVGAMAFQPVLKFNSTVSVLDLRVNPLIEREVFGSLMEQLMINTGESELEYPWLVIREPKAGRIRPQKRKSTSTNQAQRGGRAGVSKNASVVTKKSAAGFIPWRTAARVGKNRHKLGRQTAQDGLTVKKKVKTAVTKPRATSSPLVSEEDERISNRTITPDSSIDNREKLKDMQVEMEILKHRLEEESRARATADSRILELQVENRRLQQEIRLLKTKQTLPPSRPISFNGMFMNTTLDQEKNGGARTILEDDRVLESIEASFRQFHGFLDLLKGSKFSELAHVLGENSRLPEPDRGLSPITEESSGTAS
ncbi:centrosomal protein of 78 kDa-like isoform X2 [Orbicella faveolata]|uniref:centrosomal protein of 78 kDa-like isoform X2 n=1 Tax=Orbicella faveolata TaxID=48498 RepID=UPI0009E37CFA|nr:centrosomal protein of 78 kDa-like isoform X2 [Orbicella faveolata]